MTDSTPTTIPTPNLVLAYSSQDAALAVHLEKDLQAKGYATKTELTPDRQNVLIVLLSPNSTVDTTVQETITQALDNGQHIIPLQIGMIMMPKLINHLQAINFSDRYPLNALLERIAYVTSPEAKLPLKVLTPAARKANRSTGYWLAILAIIWFIIGIIAVGVFGIQEPQDEFNNVDTEVAATIGVYLELNLPHTTQEAENFPATLQAAPTAQLPFLIATATAMVAPTPGQ